MRAFGSTLFGGGTLRLLQWGVFFFPELFSILFQLKSFSLPLTHSIERTQAELARALLNNMPWHEGKHWRMNAEIRTNIFRALMVYEESLQHVEGNVDPDGDGQFMPWDDFRHVIKAWSVWSAQRSLEAAIRGDQQEEEEDEDEDEEEDD